jgi:hypothetical protein
LDSCCAGPSNESEVFTESNKVRFSDKTAIERAMEKVSALKGPKKAERGAMIILESALANQDVQQQRRMVRIASKMQLAFEKGFPELDRQLIGDVVADLASLWSLRQKLDKDLDKLFQMRFPRHRNHLHSFLIDIEARQLDEAWYLIHRLRKRLPRLLKELDRQEHGDRRSRGTKPRESRQPRA